MHLGSVSGLAFATTAITAKGFLLTPSQNALSKKPLSIDLKESKNSSPRLPVSAIDSKLLRGATVGQRYCLNEGDDDAVESEQSVQADSKSIDQGARPTETAQEREVTASDAANEADQGRKPKHHLFGLDELGNKVRSMFKRASHGGEIYYEINDELHQCYPQCDLDAMKYTIQHDDVSGQMKLTINSEFEDHDNTFYHQLMRDSVFAEWQGLNKEGDDGDGCGINQESLHVKMHVTENEEGPGPLWEHWLKRSKLPEPVVHELIHIGGELRSKIFHAHKEDALEAIFHVIKDLLHDNPQLMNAPIFIHYLSDMEVLREVEALGPIGEWFEKIQHRHDNAFNVPSTEVVTKNLKVWSDSIQDLKKVVMDVYGRVIPKLMSERAREASHQLVQLNLLETFVLMIMIANDNMRC